MSQLLPLFLDLHGRPVLLVGAGSVALAKLRHLLKTGAAITVVALSVTPEFRALASEHPGQVRLQERSITFEDLQKGWRLVISATNDGELNGRLAQVAEAENLWFNAVDDTRYCTFNLAAAFSRGPLQVAVGTEGSFPGLSGALRAFLEEAIPDGDGDLLQQLAELRLRIRREVPDPETRSQALRRALEGLKSDYFRALHALAELS